MGSLDGSIPELERVGTQAASTIEEKLEVIVAKRFAQLDLQLPALAMLV